MTRKKNVKVGKDISGSLAAICIHATSCLVEVLSDVHSFLSGQSSPKSFQ